MFVSKKQMLAEFDKKIEREKEKLTPGRAEWRKHIVQKKIDQLQKERDYILPRERYTINMRSAFGFKPIHSGEVTVMGLNLEEAKQNALKKIAVKKLKHRNHPAMWIFTDVRVMQDEEENGKSNG